MFWGILVSFSFPGRKFFMDLIYLLSEYEIKREVDREDREK